MLMRKSLTVIVCLLAVLSLIAGCASKKKQLEDVAKDWCLTIRASQVIPVYPLTEDLQPGDVFLVTTSVHDQAELYDKKGFLPLDQLVTRLGDKQSAYRDFYMHDYFKGYADKIPHDRPEPEDSDDDESEESPGGATTGQPGEGVGTTASGTNQMLDRSIGVANTVVDKAHRDADLYHFAVTQPEDTERSDEDEDSGEGGTESDGGNKQKKGNTGRYQSAELPAAQFPTYSFEVRAGQGLKLAIPVQGVPVGLGLLRSRRASGSVIIRDAYTYALPGEDLLRMLVAWSSKPDVRHELTRLKASVGCRSIFLRVVNRVYLVGGVDIALSTAEAGSGGLDVGAPQAINLLSMETKDLQQFKTNAKLFSDAQSALGGPLNEMKVDAAGNVLPGGSVRVAYASGRNVRLEEDFDRLLAIGYLGFDVEILEGGGLGPAVSTFYRVEHEERTLVPGASPANSMWSRMALQSIYASMEELREDGSPVDAQQASEILADLDALATSIPEFELPLMLDYPRDPGDGWRATHRTGPDVPEAINNFSELLTLLGSLDKSKQAYEQAGKTGWDQFLVEDWAEAPNDEDGEPMQFVKLSEVLSEQSSREIIKKIENIQETILTKLNQHGAVTRAANFWSDAAFGG